MTIRIAVIDPKNILINITGQRKFSCALSVLATFLLFINIVSATQNISHSKGHVLELTTSCSANANRTVLIQRNQWAQCLLSARNIPGTVPLAKDDLIPTWVNITLFTAGQKFATRNIGYIGVSHFFALIFENFIPDIKDVLITTGSTSTMDRAVKRYTATATQVLLWYRNSLTDPTEKEILLNSLTTIRKLHIDGAIKASSKLGNDLNAYLEGKQNDMLHDIWKEQKSRSSRSIVFDDSFWEALEKDLLLSNVPQNHRKFPSWNTSNEISISQFSQALTQFSFAGLPVIFHRELGISHVTKEELQAFVHMWAVLGHALGIKDEFNICLNDNFEKSIMVFKDMYYSYFLPAMFQIDWRVRLQLGVYLDALQHMDQVITPRLIMYRFLRDIVKIQPSNLFRQLTAIEKLYIGLVDSLMSNNLDANRFFINRGGMFLLDVNGYQHFGSHYSSDVRKSRGAFYTKDKLLI